MVDEIGQEEFVVIGGDMHGHVGEKVDGYEGVHHHHRRFTSILSVVHTKARVRRYQLMLDLIVACLFVSCWFFFVATRTLLTPCHVRLFRRGLLILQILISFSIIYFSISLIVP